jgi:hypothetical protein
MKLNYFFKVAFITTCMTVFCALYTIAQEKNKAVKAAPSNESSKVENSIWSKLPSDFPKFTDTGNPEQDILNFNSRKGQWLNSKYPVIKDSDGVVKNQDREIIESIVPIYILKRDYENAPAERRAIVDMNPDKYIIK